MNKSFQDTLQQKIQRSQTARAELLRKAKEKREAGQWEAYWSLAHPRSLGDLYLLAGDMAAAQAEWQAALQYYAERTRWSAEHGTPMRPSAIQAGLLLRAGQYQPALAIYRTLAAAQGGPAERGMYGIAHIQCGALEEGRALLRERMQALDKGAGNSLPDLHHLAECAFWQGALDTAARYSQVAAQHWPSPTTIAPVRAFEHLLQFAKTGNPTDHTQAVHWFTQAMERFFTENDLLHAVDAHEYLRLCIAWQPGGPLPKGLLLQGISFLHEA